MVRMSNRQGLTLIELLTVVVIIGILASMAITSMGKDRDARQFSAAAREVLTALNSGRSEAISSGRNVVVDDSVNGDGATQVVVFRDVDDNWTFTDGTDVMVVRVTFPRAAELQAAIDAHAFNPRGQLIATTGMVSVLSFSICESLDGGGCGAGSSYVTYTVNPVGVVTSANGVL